MKNLFISILLLFLATQLFGSNGLIDSLDYIIDDATFAEKVEWQNNIEIFINAIEGEEERLKTIEYYQNKAFSLNDSLFISHGFNLLGNALMDLNREEESNEAFKVQKHIEQLYGWSIFTNPNEKIDLIDHLFIFKDSLGSFTFDEIRNNNKLYKENVQESRIAPNNVYWFKLNILSNPQKFETHYFEIGNSNFWNKSTMCDSITVWLVHEDGKVDKQFVGNSYDKLVKALPSKRTMFLQSFDKGERATFYMRLKGNPSFEDGFYLHRLKKGWWSAEFRKSHFTSLFFGAIGVQALFFLLLYFGEKDRMHLYFVLMLLGLVLYFSNILLEKEMSFLWGLVNFKGYSRLIGMFIFSVGLIKFTENYFTTDSNQIVSSKWLKWYIIVNVVLIIILWGFVEKTAYLVLLEIPQLIFLFLFLIPLIRNSKKIEKIYKRLYLLAFSPVLLVLMTPILFVIIGFLYFILVTILPESVTENFDLVLPTNYQRLNLPISTLIMCVLLAFISAFRTNRLKKEKQNALQKNLDDQTALNKVISRFVPNEFIRSLGKTDIKEVNLGDYAEKVVTVFFSDIRAYTTLSEGMTPEENFEFVKAYNKIMGPIIQSNNGFINQYLGDGIMAIFPDSPDDALNAAIQMQNSIQAFNKEVGVSNGSGIQVGMGMHTGSLVMGIIGDENRLDAATISDTVNTAARIESLTKEYKTRILLSESSKDQMQQSENFKFNFIGQVKVKGKKKSVNIYECLGTSDVALSPM